MVVGHLAPPTYLEVLLPLKCVIALGDLWLKEVKVSHGCCKASKRLSATPSHPDQKSIASRLFDDTTDTRQVFQEVPVCGCALWEGGEEVGVCIVGGW